MLMSPQLRWLAEIALKKLLVLHLTLLSGSISRRRISAVLKMLRVQILGWDTAWRRTKKVLRCILLLFLILTSVLTPILAWDFLQRLLTFFYLCWTYARQLCPIDQSIRLVVLVLFKLTLFVFRCLKAPFD